MSTAAAALTTSTLDTGEPLVASFKAPLLTRILEDADPEQRHVVLDLGGPSDTLIERLGDSRPCRIEIADIVANGGIDTLNGLESLEEPDPTAIPALLPEGNSEPLDLVFLWDLPNYLRLSALRALVDVIGKRAAPGCRLHMLITYSRREMPLAPGHYVPADEGKMTQHLPSGETIAAPRYSPEDLGIAVGGFRYERGVLLSNGMQEFVYAWPTPKVADKPPAY